jgi:hypothetical protein
LQLNWGNGKNENQVDSDTLVISQNLQNASLEDLIKNTFEDLENGIATKAILAAKNADVDKMNEKVLV